MAYSFLRGERRRGALSRLWTRALDHVPSDCPLCGVAARGGALCVYCKEAVLHSRGRGPHCPRCALMLGALPACPDCAALGPAFDRVVAAFDYAEPGDDLIRQFKAGGQFRHARPLAGMLVRAMSDAGLILPAATIVVPVPARREALRRRGYNPAAELARQVAVRLGLACLPVLRAAATGGPAQKQLGRAARMRHAAQAYCCIRRLDGRVAAVVDDVLTTGATLDGAARALKAAGAARVYGLVAARTPYAQHGRN